MWPCQGWCQNNCEPDWRYSIYGQLPGLRTMQAEDLNNDGYPEILVNARSFGPSGLGFWYILNYDPASGDYKKVWTSRPYTNRQVSLIRLIDLDEDGKSEIFISDDYANTEIYNGESLELIATFDLPTAALTNLLYEDADNDGTKELVAGNEFKVYLINPETFNVESQLEIAARNFAVGQVDSDPELEIVTGDGNVYQLNGTVLNEEWNAFDISDFYNIRYIKLIQVDEDDELEVVICYGTQIQVLDVADQEIKYESSISFRITELLLYDADQNGRDEIYIGDELGSVWAFSPNLQSRSELIDGWQYQVDGVCSFVITDANNNGQANVVLSDGCRSTGSDHVRVFDFNDGVQVWKSFHLDPPFTGLEYLNTPPVILGVSKESDSGYEESILVKVNPLTGEELQLNSNIFDGFYIFGIEKVNLSSDAAPNQLLVFGGSITGGGGVWLLNLNASSILKRNVDQFGTYYSGLAVDLDNDGTKEIVLGNRNGLDIYNAELELIEEEYIEFDYTRDIEPINIDNDTHPELVVVNDYLNVYDDNLNLLWRSTARAYTCVASSDWNHDGVSDIIAGNEYGTVSFISTSNYQVFQSIDFGNEDIDGLYIDDLNDDDTEEIIVSSEGRIFFIDQTGQVIPLIEVGPSPGIYDSMEFEDVDGDGIKEMIVGNDYAIIIVEGTCYEALLTSVDKANYSTEKNLVVYPNPTAGFLSIIPPFEGAFTTILYDAAGREILRKENAVKIDISSNPAGLYWVKAIGENRSNVAIRRVIKM